MRGKIDEYISSISPDFPHILCFSEHHLKKPELDQINVDGYRLGVTYCRQVVKKKWCLYICEKKT